MTADLPTALARLPRKPKRVTASLNPATGAISGAWVTLHFDFEGPLCDLSGWLLRQCSTFDRAGLEVGEISTGRAGLSETDREGVYGGTVRFGVRCAAPQHPRPARGEGEGE